MGPTKLLASSAYDALGKLQRELDVCSKLVVDPTPEDAVEFFHRVSDALSKFRYSPGKP